MISRSPLAATLSQGIGGTIGADFIFGKRLAAHLRDLISS
jgi:hypothetical protein